MPSIPQLGDPAPWFKAETITGLPSELHVDAGRYVLLCFLGSSTDRHAAAYLKHMLRCSSLYRDDHIVFYGIFVDPPTDTAGLAAISTDAISFLYDQNGKIAASFGVGTTPEIILLDPMLRLIARLPLDHSSLTANNAIGSLLESLPPPSGHAGVALTAPVLMVPRVFEFEFCDHLVNLHKQFGGRDSGFLIDQNGETRTAIDYRLKRRRDYVIDDFDLAQQIRDRIIRRLLPAIKQAFQFTVTRMDRYMIACYSAEENGHFTRHRDNVNAGAAHRRFAVSINLNAEQYQGGDLRFPEFGDRTYRPPTGGAVVFSCGLLHEVLPMVDGERYVFVPFLYGEDDVALRLANNARLGDGEYRYKGTEDWLVSPPEAATRQSA